MLADILQFVLRGDFILSANREDILKDNQWNNALGAATADLIMTSIDAFNKKDLLKYTWPRYMVSYSNASDIIFQSFFPRLLAYLRSRPVLLSQGDTFETHSSLCYVPPQFTDGSSTPEPLLLGSEGPKAFASNCYEAADLEKLSVPSLGNEAFIDLLER